MLKFDTFHISTIPIYILMSNDFYDIFTNCRAKLTPRLKLSEIYV